MPNITSILTTRWPRRAPIIAKRGDEIYADDTMAWVLAAMGRWKQARAYAVRAARYGTADPELQYHAASSPGTRATRAKRGAACTAALAVDASFHPFYADDARRILGARCSK